MRRYFLLVLLVSMVTLVSAANTSSSVTCNVFLKDKSMPKSLILVSKTDPILRTAIPEEQNFKDPALEETIKNMCYSILPEQLKTADARHNSAAGMAANQWGIKRRVFIFTPDGSEADKKSEIVINPSYIPHLRPTETKHKLVATYEGCFSIPLTVGFIKRYDTIIATYYTPTGDKIERMMEGWEARVFQHETDHLNGKLYDGKLDNYFGPDCLYRIVFKDAEVMEAWISKEKARQSADKNNNKH